MEKQWNDDWRKELHKTKESVYLRLCDCCNTKNDVFIITKIMNKYNPNRTIEECLERTWEWLGDWNGQVYLSDWIDENYEDILNGCL